MLFEYVLAWSESAFPIGIEAVLLNAMVGRNEWGVERGRIGGVGGIEFGNTHAQTSLAAPSAIGLRDGTDNFIVRIGDGKLSVVGWFGRHCCRTEI